MRKHIVRNAAQALVLCAMLAAMAAAGCRDVTDAPVTPGTGINGTVVQGPLSPVERPGVPNAGPLAGASIRIASPSGLTVAMVTSDGEGHFKVDLAAGTYAVEPLTFEGRALPSPGEAVTATVVAGAYTSITLQYDTGIR